MAHPGVDYLLNKGHGRYVGGRVEGSQLPTHYDFRTLRLTPSDLRAEFVNLGLAPDRRVSDAQSNASCTRRIDVSRCQPGRSQPSDSSVRRHDPAR